jgi:hypothetical protein
MLGRATAVDVIEFVIPYVPASYSVFLVLMVTLSRLTLSHSARYSRASARCDLSEMMVSSDIQQSFSM